MRMPTSARYLLVIGSLIMLAACAPPADSAFTVTRAGHEPVRITAYSYYIKEHCAHFYSLIDHIDTPRTVGTICGEELTILPAPRQEAR